MNAIHDTFIRKITYIFKIRTTYLKATFTTFIIPYKASGSKKLDNPQHFYTWGKIYNGGVELPRAQWIIPNPKTKPVHIIIQITINRYYISSHKRINISLHT